MTIDLMLASGGYGRAETVLSQEPITAFVIGFLILSLIISIMYIALKTSYKFTKEKLKNAKFDFGLAPREEVYAKVGREMGDIIIEERRIAFYRFGWLWALLGSAITFIIQAIYRSLIG